MPRKKTEAAEAMTESLGPTLPAVVQQEGEYFAAKQGAIERIESMFQFPDAYDRDETVAALRNSVTQAALLYAHSGALLLRIKAHESHGDFTRIATETVGKGEATVRRMMLAARAMIDPETGKPRPILLAISGTKGEVKKLHELMSLPLDQLDSLDAGESIGDLSIETAPVMSPTELRDALAAAEKVADDKAEKIAALQAEIDQSDREIRKLKRGGKETVEASYVEVLAETSAFGDAQFQAMRKCVAKLDEAMAQLAAIEAPASLGDDAIADAAKALHAQTVQIGSTIAALIQKQQAEFANYLDRPSANLDDTLGDEE